jgi:hypothetical protein
LQSADCKTLFAVNYKVFYICNNSAIHATIPVAISCLAVSGVHIHRYTGAVLASPPDYFFKREYDIYSHGRCQLPGLFAQVFFLQRHND